MIPQKEIQERGLMLQVVGRMYETTYNTHKKSLWIQWWESEVTVTGAKWRQKSQ